MAVVRTMITTLFLSAWLMVHAVFLANLPPEEAVEKKLLPLQIPSVFHMPWFRTLVSNHMNEEMLRFTHPPPQQQPTTSVWTYLFPSVGVGVPGGRASRFVSYSYRSSSRRATGTATVPDRNGENWLRPLSWAVTAMTMAEWLTFLYFIWRFLWQTVLRPLVMVVSLLLIFLLGFYCVKGYYYALGASSVSPENPSSAMLPYITTVDDFLHAAGREVLSWNGRVLHGVDQLLSVVLTPASVLERQQQDKQQLLLGRKQQNADMMSAAAWLFDLLHRIQVLLGGGSFEGGGTSVRPNALGGEL